MKSLSAEQLQLEREAIPFVLVTLVSIRGSAPQDLGAKAIVTSRGLYAGTIGGGKVEAAAIKKCQEILTNDAPNPPQIITWNLQRDIGMTCGGEVTLLFEHIIPNSWRIVIFGAGHIGQALVKILSHLQCHVTCIDPRPEWIEKIKGQQTIIHEKPEEIVSQFSEKCFFVSVTKGHAFDVPILYQIFKNFPHSPYVGVIGSEIKGKKIKQELRDLGVHDEWLQKLKVPMGLPLGSNDPFEIAISIVAELLMVRDLEK